MTKKRLNTSIPSTALPRTGLFQSPRLQSILNTTALSAAALSLGLAGTANAARIGVEDSQDQSELRSAGLCSTLDGPITDPKRPPAHGE